MKLLLSSLLFVSIASSGAVAFGQTPLNPITPVPATTPHGTSVPVVVAVDADTITVQNGLYSGKAIHHEKEDQKKLPPNQRMYTVTRFTEITINGHKSQLSDIKKGMQVRVTAGTTPTEASIIAAKVDRSVLIPVP
jgi:hypothetical protein